MKAQDMKGVVFILGVGYQAIACYEHRVTGADPECHDCQRVLTLNRRRRR